MRRTRIAVLAFAILVLPLPAAGASRPGDNSALSTMERIAVAAQKCWFSGKDPVFKGLRLSPELTSFAGKPRILIVPAKNISARPSLVVEAHGNPARMNAYGKLIEDGPHKTRLASDIIRWSKGGKGCV